VELAQIIAAGLVLGFVMAAASEALGEVAGVLFAKRTSTKSSHFTDEN
jgi:hypothetical protein